MEIINGTIYTMEDGVIEKGFVRTQGEKITQVGEMADYVPQQDQVFDAQGCIVMPGFVDPHTHLGLFEDGLAFEGEDGNEDTDPATPQLRAMDAINTFDRCFDEALASGVTSVVSTPGSANPIGGQMVLMKTYGRRIENMIIKEPLAMKMALGENPKCAYNSKNQAPVTRMATASIIREQLKKAAEYYDEKMKLEVEDTEEEEADSLEFDFKCESLLPVITGEMPVHFHAHRADDMYTAMRIAKEFSLDYVLVHATEGKKIVQDLKEEKVPVIVGPVMTDRSKPELREQSEDTAGYLSKEGVLVALTTDHPETPLKYYPLCGAICVKHGMDYMEALKAMTINGAIICHAQDRIGSLKEGKDADIVVFRGDPLNIMSKIELVMVNGQVAVKNR